MANVLVEEKSLSAIADAIRDKGVDGTFKPAEMAGAIKEISGGGESIDKDLYIYGDCSYLLGNGYLTQYFIDNDFSITLDALELEYLFNGNRLDNIDDLKVLIGVNTYAVTPSLGHLFTRNNTRTTLPIIKFGKDSPTVASLTYMFSECSNLVYIPDDYLPENLSASSTTTAFAHMFSSCYKLKKIPDFAFKVMKNSVKANPTTKYSMSQTFNNCAQLRELINIPVMPAYTSTAMFTSAFSGLDDLQRLTFEEYSGQVSWGKVSINLYDVGYADTLSKQNHKDTDLPYVQDMAQYELYKDNYWTANPDFSNYNHDSAVETINSLPKIASGTITFMGEAGKLTDGGAINTLTPEEIAVATEKGWTVSLV